MSAPALRRALPTRVLLGAAALAAPAAPASGLPALPTAALPSAYRVEMTLRTVDFGGQRNGSWTYPDARINGYSPTGCKTNHPWATSGDFSRKPCDWADVRTDSNGFYFLGIMDYPRPAPHNNVFVHTHRKGSMDGYNRYQYTDFGSVLCDPSTKMFQPYSSGTGNGVNMIFNTAARRYASQPGTEYLMESECGLRTSGAIVSQEELRPELMPNETYRFAIERVGGGYTLEMTGTFARIGYATLRYHRTFVQDGLPIWHYNQTAAEYDGAFNADWTYKGPYGTYTDHSVWPAGSAYPDYFMIGDRTRTSTRARPRSTTSGSTFPPPPDPGSSCRLPAQPLVDAIRRHPDEHGGHGFFSDRVGADRAIRFSSRRGRGRTHRRRSLLGCDFERPAS